MQDKFYQMAAVFDYIYDIQFGNGKYGNEFDFNGFLEAWNDTYFDAWKDFYSGKGMGAAT